MERQNREIESLLTWAYVEELPKGYRDGENGVTPAISPMFKYANLGGPIDNWSKEPGFPIGMGTQPHRDAIAIHNAVMLLDEIVLKPDGANHLLGDLSRYLTDAERFACTKLRVQMPGLVSLHARLGNRPIWEMDFRRARYVGRSRNSVLRKGRGRKSAKLQGEDCLLDGDGNPLPAAEILFARFEYFAWHAALCTLANTELYEYRATPPVALQRPWEQPDLRLVLSDHTKMDARQLATGRASAMRALPLAPKRRPVLPQLPAASHGPVKYLGFDEVQRIVKGA